MFFHSFKQLVHEDRFFCKAIHAGFLRSMPVLFPDIEEPKRKTQSVMSGIDRGTRMIADVMQRTFGDDLNEVKALASSVGVIRKGSSCELTYIPPCASELLKKYGIEMEMNHNAKD